MEPLTRIQAELRATGYRGAELAELGEVLAAVLDAQGRGEQSTLLRRFASDPWRAVGALATGAPMCSDGCGPEVHGVVGVVDKAKDPVRPRTFWSRRSAGRGVHGVVSPGTCPS